MNTRIHILIGTSALLALMSVTFPEMAQAQKSGLQDAGAKLRGDVYWPGRASRRYIESARTYAQDVQTYVARSTQAEPSVVKEIKSELGRYLDDSQKHLTSMKKDFAADKEAVAEIESLEKDLAMAIEHNKAMIACCENEKFDKVATMACCDDLVKQLDKVHANHVSLMRKLNQKYGAKAVTK